MKPATRRSWPQKVRKRKGPTNVIFNFGIGAKRTSVTAKRPRDASAGGFVFHVHDAEGKKLEIVCDVAGPVTLANGAILFDDVLLRRGELICDGNPVPFEVKDHTVRCSDLRKAVLEWKLNKK